MAGQAGRNRGATREALTVAETPVISKAMKVFLSYASEDRQVAQEVAQALRDTGHDVYPAPHWPQDVGAALDRAEAFVVLLSPAAVGSPFVGQEIRLALLSQNLEERVVPVVLKPSTQVPWILRTLRPIKAAEDRSALAKSIDERLRERADRVRK